MWAMTTPAAVCTDTLPTFNTLYAPQGGNSGIGKDTAVAMAMRGARVVIACRDPDKAERAVREIKFKSHCLNISHMDLDLANLQSVRDFCKCFLQKEKRLDVLINNAGDALRIIFY